MKNTIIDKLSEKSEIELLNSYITEFNEYYSGLLYITIEKKSIQ